MMVLPQISHSSMELQFSSSQRQNGKKVDARGTGPKRNNSNGVRVIGNRIYDSENGKTCHQCRQKTRDFAASCKNLINGKHCTLKLCHKCLLNRYGEKAEEVDQMSDWTCPKCRGICNCSFCMKKRGQQPTGALARTAKASGFRSVSDMLCVNSPEDLESNQKQKCGDNSSSVKVLTSNMQGALDKNLVVVLSGKLEKENSLDLKVQTLQEKSKNTKRKKLKEISNSDSLDTDSAIENKSLKRHRRSAKAGIKVSNQLSEKETKVVGNHDAVPAQMNGPEAWARNDLIPDIDKMCGKNCKGTVTGNGSTAAVRSQITNNFLLAVSGKQTQVDRNCCTLDEKTNSSDIIAANDILDGPVTLAPKDHSFSLNQYDMQRKHGKYLNNSAITDAADNAGSKSLTGIAGFPIASLISEREKIEEEIPLPPGTELTEILDIEFAPEDVGNALQLLEFCRVFGKAIDLKKGEAKAILRELGRKQSLRRGHSTLVVQFQIRLLTIILIDSGKRPPSLTTTTRGNNSWLKALEDLITESELLLKDFPLDWLEEGISGYNNLDLSKRLRLLNFLCDEALCTEKLRSYIDDQNSRYAEEVKEAKAKVAAAKEKEKGLRQKLQDEMAKALMSNVGTLSMEEHDALLRKIKSEAAEAHAEMLEAKGIIPKRAKSSDATRIRHELLDTNGQAFWKLQSYNDESSVLLQEIKIEDETAPAAEEKWFVYGPEKKDELDKYISSRANRARRHMVSHSSEANMYV